MYITILGTCIQICVFIIIIFIGHSCWIYLKETYSIKKTKDLVNIQISKYKQIINDLQENNENKNVQTTLDEKETESMDNILTNFMENELSNNLNM
jgi:hypothetical protein